MAADDGRRSALSPLLRYDDFRPLSATVRVDVAARSIGGRSRQVNEDHYIVARFGRDQEVLASSLSFTDIPERFEEHAFAMLVADGLGGTGHGAVASRVALSTLAHMALHVGKWNVRVDPEVAGEILDRVEWFCNEADRAVRARAHADTRLEGMATTLTVAYSAGDDLFVANVGHSRAYLFRDGGLTQLTRDGTLAQLLTDLPWPASVGRGIQDLGHILTDTIGGDVQGPNVAVGHFRLLDGDCILLCTNGLTDAVPDNEIADVLALRRSSADVCRLLLHRARLQDAEDNATVVAATYRIPKAAPPEPFVV